MSKLWLSGLLSWLLAQSAIGDLVLVSETGEPFRLYINGEWVSDAPVTRAEVHDLPEGSQRTTIYIYPSEGQVVQIRRTLYIEGGMVEYYAIRKRKRQYVIVLYNRLPRQTESTPPVGSPPSPPPSPGGNSPSSGQNQNTTIVFNPTIQVQTGSGTQVSSPPPSAPFPPSGAFPPSGSGYTGPCNCSVPISRESFLQALRTLRQEPFEQTRLEIARGIARQNCLLAQDVRDMMQALDFENSRLELAKFAYDYTHDLSNYFIVSEAFQFSSSREALMAYIQGRPTRQQCNPTIGGGQQPVSPIRPCSPCMNPQSFLQALATIRQISSEPTRLETAKQIATTNCLASHQVRDLCQAFTSEVSRIEFAKYAYTRSCDPQNYFVVNQAFSSVASQQELAEYIQRLAGGR
ncbi:MAG: DUF4476 domain-containing protein [Bacteroidia bacterium]|nr:DUF4476 domain-containing protein [Bacteroidia bacterium]